MNAWVQENRWLWGAAAALLLANVLAFGLLILPARAQRIDQQDRLLDLQRRIRSLEHEVRSSEGALTLFRDAEQFRQGFPAQADLVGIVGRLGKLARGLSLQVPSVSYQPSEIKAADLTKVTLTMGVQGSYANIRRYLYELEGLRRQLVIERLSIRDPKATAELDVQLQLAVYIR